MGDRDPGRPGDADPDPDPDLDADRTPSPAPEPPGPPAPQPAAPHATPEPPLPVRGAPQLHLRIPRQRVLATRGISMFVGCDRPCRVSFRARIETSPLARASGRTLQRRGVFRKLGGARRLPGTGAAERRVRLRLTPRAARTLRRTMHYKARVAVVIVARVRGAGGTRTVTRRIVLKRRPRTAASGGRLPR